MDDYKTIKNSASASLTEKKSEFIALVSPANTEQSALAILEQARAAHRTASHHVYAYRLRQDARQRYSDDGEPAKTAGLPILSVLERAGLQDVALVVTRYFGGTLLGTGGLVRAYTQAAQKALQAATILTIRRCVKLRFCLPYAQYQPAQRLLEAAKAQLDDPVFAQGVTLSATLPAGEEPPLIQQLRELSRGEVEIVQSEPFYIPF